MLEIIAIVTLFILGSLEGYFMLGTLRRSAMEPRPPVQFRTAEILLLSVEIGVFGAMMGLNFDLVRAIAFGLVALSLSTWWLMGVRWLSHAGVKKASTRLWMLAVAVPLAFGFVPGMIVLFLSLGAIESSDGTTTINISGLHQIAIVALSLGHIPLINWMVRHALSRERRTFVPRGNGFV